MPGGAHKAHQPAQAEAYHLFPSHYCSEDSSPERQASLDAIVKAVVGYPSFEPTKQKLQAIALQNQWDRLLATNWNDFCDSFDGKVHCESTIASIKSATPTIDNETTGGNKRVV